jgi:hypothetical protein
MIRDDAELNVKSEEGTNHYTFCDEYVYVSQNKTALAD